MVKRFRFIFSLLIILIMLSSCISFGTTKINGDSVTVHNLLPEITIYANNPSANIPDKEKLQILVDDEDTEVSYAGNFKGTDEGTTYFYLVDISASLSDKEMDSIKDTMLFFNDNLGENDRVVLIPFGETVYGDEVIHKAGDEELLSQINDLKAEDDYTQLYAAMDKAVNLAEQEKENMRKIAVVFSDGVDDTDEGGILTKDEAINQMKDNAIPLYAFGVGNNKEGKDLLGEIARSAGGEYFNLNAGKEKYLAGFFKNRMENTLVFKTTVKNSEDIINAFTLRILEDGDEILVKENITAHKDADSKDAKSVAVKKFFISYRWLFAVILIALIVLGAILYIRKNKGVVNVDGKIVYGSRVQKKYHVKVKDFNSRKVEFIISVNGGKSYRQEINIEESLIVGRSKICDLVFEDKTISRQHFSIEIKNGELYLKDLESTSGTWINGVRITAAEKLSDGDTITAGRVNIKLVL